MLFTLYSSVLFLNSIYCFCNTMIMIKWKKERLKEVHRPKAPTQFSTESSNVEGRRDNTLGP